MSRVYPLVEACTAGHAKQISCGRNSLISVYQNIVSLRVAQTLFACNRGWAAAAWDKAAKKGRSRQGEYVKPSDGGGEDEAGCGCFLLHERDVVAGAYKSDFGQLPLPLLLPLQSTPLPQLQPQQLQLQSALTSSDEKSRQKAAAASACLPATRRIDGHFRQWQQQGQQRKRNRLQHVARAEGGGGTAEAARPANCVFRGFSGFLSRLLLPLLMLLLLLSLLVFLLLLLLAFVIVVCSARR